MTKGFFLLLISIITCFSISSCCKKRVYCNSASIDFAFTGFERANIRNFVLRRYAVGEQWGKALDSATFVYSGPGHSSTKRDTVYFSDYSTTGKLREITAGNDWGIYLPALGKTIFITTIFEQDHRFDIVKCGDDNATCTKAVTNFSLNSTWRDGAFAYLNKEDI